MFLLNFDTKHKNISIHIGEIESLSFSSLWGNKMGPSCAKLGTAYARYQLAVSPLAIQQLRGSMSLELATPSPTVIFLATS